MRAAAASFQELAARFSGPPDLSASPRARRAAAMAGLAVLGTACGAAVGAAGLAALILFAVVVACAFCVRDYRSGVVLLIVVMPISQSYIFPHEMFGITGLNPLNLVMAATLGSLVMNSAGKGELRDFVPRTLALRYILPFTMGALLGMGHVHQIPSFFRELEMIFFSDAVGYVRDMYFKPLLFVLYALLVATAVYHSRTPRKFLTPILVSVILMSAVSLIYFVASGITLAQAAGTYARAFLSALGMHANDLGRLYACAYALLLFVWDRTGNLLLKTVLLLAMVLVVLALLVTFSRGAFFGFILVNVVYLFSRRHVKTLLLAALAIPVALYFTPGAVWSRMTMGFGESINTVSAGRVGEIWLPLLPTLADSPIWGKGLGSIMWSSPMVEGRILQVGHPHNAYLQATLDTGVIGLVLFLAFWIHVWRGFRALRRDERMYPEMQGFFEGAAAGLLAFLVAGLAGSSLMPVPEQSFLWLAVGMMYGFRRRFAAGQS